MPRAGVYRDAMQGGRPAVGPFPGKGRPTPQRARYTPALRVALKPGARGVANLAKGTTLGCGSRLAISPA